MPPGSSTVGLGVPFAANGAAACASIPSQARNSGMLSITDTPRFADVLERLAVREAAARGGERAAHRHIAQPQSCLQLVGQVLHLEVGPDANDPGAHGAVQQWSKRL